jgi:hypothetical protein
MACPQGGAPKGTSMSIENEAPNEAEATAELAKLSDATLYIAEREEQEDVGRIESEAESEIRQLQEKVPELKEARKMSRYQRMKAGREKTAQERDQYKQRAEELEQKYERGSEERDAYAEPSEGPPETQSSAPSDADTARLESSLEASKHMYGPAFDNAYQAFVEHCRRTGDKAAYESVMNAGDVGQALVEWHNQMGNPTPSPESLESEVQRGRQEQDYQQQLAARDEQIRVQAELNLRVEQFAGQCPDFHQAIEEASFMFEGIDAPVFNELAKRSPLAPEIAYLMAKDVFSDNSMGIFEQVQAVQNDPIAQARLVGALEQVIYVSRKGGSAPMPRATKAPAPLSRVRGGATPPRDVHALAAKDDASDYIAARRRNA